MSSKAVALAVVALLGGCGVSENDAASREGSSDCSHFDTVHAAYWKGYQSLADSYFANPSSAVKKWTTEEDRQVEGVEFAHGKVIREWPLVEDETLKYLMQSMAEAADQGIWRRNFTSASSYCDLPDMPYPTK
jgi:hypothetical protein